MVNEIFDPLIGFFFLGYYSEFVLVIGERLETEFEVQIREGKIISFSQEVLDKLNVHFSLLQYADQIENIFVDKCT